MLTTFEGDSLSKLMMNVEGFKYYARMPGPNQDLYSGLYQYWMSEISNRLDKYAQTNPDLKYNFKFRYLRAKCTENKYIPAPKITEFEKVVNNIADSKYSYLYRRIWSTTLINKFFLFIIFISTGLAYIVSFFQIIKKIKK